MFGVTDYVIVCALLAITVFMGIYNAHKKKSESSLHPIAVIASILATSVCPFTTVVIPSEVYMYGADFYYSSISQIIAVVIYSFLYMPTILSLQLPSIYEYLELRFNKWLRFVSSFAGAAFSLIYITSVMYMAALSLAVMAESDPTATTCIIISICVLYTCVGGYKAVVWSDLFQFVILFVISIATCVLLIVNAGGIGNVWNIGIESQRLEPPSLKFDITSRYNIWSFLISHPIATTAFLVLNQPLFQRLTSLPSLSYARWSFFFLEVFFFVYFFLLVLSGLAMYAIFKNCDPVQSQQVQQADAMLPFAVKYIVQDYPGVQGLFIAGVLSACFSTFSSYADSYALIIIEDYLPGSLKRQLNNTHLLILQRFFVILLGVVCIGLMFAIRNNPSIFQILMSYFSVYCIAVFSMYFMGMMLPWVNVVGALAGSILGSGFILWICYGFLTAAFSGKIAFGTKPLSIAGCELNSSFATNTSSPEMKPDGEDIFILYKISYMWYTAIGILISLICGIIVSFLVGFNDVRSVDTKLLSPMVVKLLRKWGYIDPEMKIINGKAITVLNESKPEIC